MMKRKIRILIVDDHAILRVGLASLLNTHEDFNVVGDAESGLAAIRLVPRLKPDVIIVDLLMPELNGIETTARIIKDNPCARILILSTFGTSDGISHALDAGARGAILKNADIEELATAIRTVADGERYISRELTRIMDEDPPIQDLSQRQLEILDLLLRGLTSVDIAKALNISHDMVREHTSALFKKLGVANRTEAVAVALRKHLVEFL